MAAPQVDPGASQLVLEAREAAIDEICRLLQDPEDLSRLPTLMAEYESKQTLHKAQLTGLVQSNVEATKSGIEVLGKGQKLVLKLRAGFEQIDRCYCI